MGLCFWASRCKFYPISVISGRDEGHLFIRQGLLGNYPRGLGEDSGLMPEWGSFCCCALCGVGEEP